MTKSQKNINIADCTGRSTCPLTNTLDIIGDKWTLIIIRDMLFLGKSQFGDFLDSPEGISTNILTERLKKLEEYGLVEKTPYQKKPLRHSYALTPRGLELKPVMAEIAKWGLKNIKGTQGPTEKQLDEMSKKYKNRLTET